MKKIGILTLHFHTNYGGILQAYALQAVLNECGADALVVKDVLYSNGWLKRLKDRTKKILAQLGVIKLRPTSRLDYNCQRFVNRNINVLSLNGQQEELDTIVVGSDQIWRAKFHDEFVPAMLDFTADWNINRVAYGCSLGTSDGDFSDSDYELARKCLPRFKAISMREQGALDFIANKIGYTGPLRHVLDPTFLLSAHQYMDRFADKGKDASIPEKGVFYYLLDETEYKLKVVKQVAEHLRVSCFTTNKEHDCPIENWICCYNHAVFVVTDSFHGTALSVNFNIPFISVGNALRGMERFHSLLSMFNLSDRLVLEGDRVQEEFIDSVICYDDVNKILDIERKKSMSFIEQYILC